MKLLLALLVSGDFSWYSLALPYLPYYSGHAVIDHAGKSSIRDSSESNITPVKEFRCGSGRRCENLYKAFGADLSQVTDPQVTDPDNKDILTCSQKYDQESLEHMQKLFFNAARAQQRPEKVFIGALLHNNAEILPAWAEAVTSFITRIGTNNAFVSVIESGSDDGTEGMLLKFGRDLRMLQVEHAISTNADVVVPVFEEGGSVNRINFLAGMRNAVLEPLHQMGAGNFLKVVFLNDVFVCEGDIWRLVAFDADMTCGFDFNGGIFWDQWVYEGQKMDDNCYDHESLEYQNCRSETPLQVKCCWDGMASIDTKVFQAGIRFRAGAGASATDSDCAASECSLLCRDMKKLGFSKIVADPTVQVAYNSEALSARRPISAGAMLDDRTTFKPHPENEDPDEFKCCPLDQPGQRYVDWDRCTSQNLKDDKAVRYKWWPAEKRYFLQMGTEAVEAALSDKGMVPRHIPNATAQLKEADPKAWWSEQIKRGRRR